MTRHDPAVSHDEPSAGFQRRTMLAVVAATPVALGLTPSAGHAADPKPKAPDVNPLVVDIGAIAVPVAAQGRLVNYLFTSIRVTAAASAGADQIRNSQFMARDAIIRAAGRSPVPSSASGFDAAGASRMMQSAIEGAFRGVRLTSVRLRDPRLMRS
jgi:hypothetical protein